MRKGDTKVRRGIRMKEIKSVRVDHGYRMHRLDEYGKLGKEG